MIPVSLQLQNFLSYGEAAPLLDFEQFHVACLSGGNGQGKSALLDAMTWALWGQARKSRGSRKPDDELLRVGAQEMEVAFVFDVEGQRYRVVRSYRESATGRTRTPGLELHGWDGEEDIFRPLTDASMRETQAAIDNIIGLDYDTFINSAFLLQGRSDEFTKKRPSERKEILARILNLDRYESLASKARERGRKARNVVQHTGQEINRLESVLEHEEEWREELEAVSERITAEKEELDDLRSQAQSLTETLADLKARRREAESLRKNIAGLTSRHGQLKKDIDALQERIETADALLQHGDEIEQRVEQLEALKKERDRLDALRDVHRGLEKQIEEVRSQLAEQRHHVEKKKERLEANLDGDRRSLTECEERLKQREELEERLEEAQAAALQLEELNAARERHRTLEEKQRTLREKILSRREALTGRLEGLQDQIVQADDELPDLSAMKERKDTLEQKVKERERLQEKLKTTKTDGQELSEKIEEINGRLAIYRAEVERQQAQLDAIRSSEDEHCPTCGTALSPAHREQAENHFQTAIQNLEDTIVKLERTLEEGEAKRVALRQSYQSLRQKVSARDGVSEELAALTEQLERAKKEYRVQFKRKEQRAELKEQLEKKTYAQEARKEMRRLEEQLEALGYDGEEHERFRTTASQTERLQKALRELAGVHERKKKLASRIAEREEELTELKQRLQSESAFSALREKIKHYRGKMEALDFDPERFAEVKKKIVDAEGAAEKKQELVHARKNRKEWSEQLHNLQARAEAILQEREEVQAKLDGTKQQLDKRPDVEKKKDEVSQKVAAKEEALQEHQNRSGQLTARLEQAEKERQRLVRKREEHSEAQAERSLYSHLRTAFGKHGIPSLIIEETLPEIEERANTLLGRLTDGEMHVRLETLKDKKSEEGTKETLDIIITDDQGVPRPYETFSGGESFRVNFALRVALAQLLAERSGVRIRTLVIDEGFGTQDEEGIQSLVEAIQATQDDFAKIIVITHLEQLKEAFPVRIEVEKDPVEGSRFEVMGV